MRNILITGAAGFIGFHVSLKLLKSGKKVIGLDNLNSYYDVSLKKSRLKILKKFKNFTFRKIDLIEDKKLSSTLSGSLTNKIRTIYQNHIESI